jgi:alkanesulfonate monooxygenase SsuD/methylene tetrahydromethanopterin reductase-like flavin-dependent oxidoreductase (luciferase family)
MAAVPVEVIDDLVVHGSADDCRAKIQSYVDNGLDTPIIATLPTGDNLLETARALASPTSPR